MIGDIVSVTVKLTIGNHDLYCKIGYNESRPMWLDITLGQSAVTSRTHSDNAIANDLENKMIATTKAQLEIICRQASKLFATGIWDLDDMVQAWRGTAFEPSGQCSQLPAIDNRTGLEAAGSSSFVTSPLDAFARYAERRAREWERMKNCA